MQIGDDAIRILILEDDEALRQGLRLTLERRGYQVDCAGNAAEAVARAREASFDLVVTDIRMEGPNGLDALKDIKSSQPDIASMVITGYSSEADSIRAIRLQVNEYLKKPFRLPVFVESVEALVAQKRKAKQAARQQLEMLKTLHWSLETVAASVDFQEPGELDPSSVLAWVDRLLPRLKLPALETAQLRLAALVGAVYAVVSAHQVG